MVLVNSISKKRVPCRAILLDENLLLRDDVIFFRVFVSELQVQG
jgi:hypothetical protein